MYLYGKNSVRERLRSDAKSISSICVRTDFHDLSILKLIKTHRVSWRRTTDKDVGRFVPGKKHQGIVAKVSSFRYISPRVILEKKDPSVLIILSKVQDPQNVGTILRTLACFGKMVLCLSKNESCQITESVLHVASGGENHVPVVLIPQMTSFLTQLKKMNYRISGTFVGEGSSLFTHSFSFPLALLLGSEKEGLDKGLLKHLDDKLTIPMGGAPLSLNVNNTAAIFAYAISKQMGI